MFITAFATDYDDTLAEHGSLDDAILASLEKLRKSGRRLILVTGRELEDLERVCPRLDLFDRVVAENGALLFRPADREIAALAAPPPPAFIEILRERGVEPLSAGHVIVASREPHERVVLEAIKDLGLELQIIFNKGAVMVLPPGINKGSGIAAALDELELAPINAVAVGDAENDHALLSACGRAVAVANAVPMLRETADWVTPSPRGSGVLELIERVIADDLASLASRGGRHNVVLGTSAGRPLALSAFEASHILVCGTSGSGKSTFTAGLLERLSGAGLQYCIVDPEGDYEHFEDSVSLGSSKQPPVIAQVVDLLSRPRQNVAINLLGVKLADRPAFFASLAPPLFELRKRTGRPHWLVIDEAHHMLPRDSDAAALALIADFPGVLFVTVHPDHIAPAAIASVHWLVVLGRSVAEMVDNVACKIGIAPPRGVPNSSPAGYALAWRIARGDAPVEIAVVPPRQEQRRHIRKYASGELGDDRSFFFRGPENKLNLRAQNLELFCQIAEGVDDDTWQYHLDSEDYSRWIRDCIKDTDLADEVAAIEARSERSVAETRHDVCAAIAQRYTSPA
jgi:hydroxymethylpyrimidine pyrophosphatase-like HAD family hydrolase